MATRHKPDRPDWCSFFPRHEQRYSHSEFRTVDPNSVRDGHGGYHPRFDGGRRRSISQDEPGVEDSGRTGRNDQPRRPRRVRSLRLRLDCGSSVRVRTSNVVRVHSSCGRHGKQGWWCESANSCQRNFERSYQAKKSWVNRLTVCMFVKSRR